MLFSFEDLEVWQKAIKFASSIVKLTETVETGRKHFRLIDQIEASASSVAMNIAEGKGRYSKKEYIQFLYVARGSLYETVTLLVIFCENNWINVDKLNDLRAQADEIGKMLSGLIAYIKKTL